MLSRIRNLYPIPAAYGSVDIYGFNQSVAIADDLEYQPRPIFQSYLAYTPALERLNADFMDGPRAPDSILFDVTSIDGHYPAMEDALVWPRILTHYDLKNAQKPLFLMERSSEDRSFSLSQLARTPAQMGDKIPVPASDDPVWATIDVKPTLSGRVVAALDKPVALALVVYSQNGQGRAFRLLPENAKAGFLLSPMIGDRLTFALLQGTQWAKQLAALRVSAIMVDTDGASDQYQRQYEVTFHRLLFPHRDISAVPGIEQLLSFQSFLQQVKVLTTDTKPGPINVNGTPVYAAPATTALAVSIKAGVTGVHIEFGIGKQSDAPHVGSAMFRIGFLNADAQNRPTAKIVWSRTLDPEHVGGDGGVQQTDIYIPTPAPAGLLLQTMPGPDKIPALSYWSAVDFH
jgi:hypothetical protein